MQSQFFPSEKQNVGPTERNASLLGGAGLVLLALTRPSRATIALAMSGGYLIYRGLTGNCLVYEGLGINRTGRGDDEGIEVEHATTINRPREEVYRYWRNFENLPNFMQHLEEVQVQSDLRSHWVTKAPLDQSVEWDAEITEERQNELIAWQSLPGSQVENSGIVRFSDAPGGRGTVVRVSMAYNPPGGGLTAVFAKLFGDEPNQQVREDLRRFKQILEACEAANVFGQTSGRADEAMQQREEILASRRIDVVQEASEESFPASDPPSWTGTGA